MAEGITGKGTIFNRWSGSAWVPIANINSISGPSASRETVDITTLDSAEGYREFIGSLRDGGVVSLQMNFVQATYEQMKNDFESDTRQQYQIVLPDATNTSLSFYGLVTELPLDIPLDDKITCDVSIKVSGQTTLDSVDIIESVETLANIEVANGTQLADVGLPSDVECTFTDDTTDDIDVLWNAGVPVYDGGTAGTYVFTGTLVPGTDVINSDALTASVSVVVGA